MHVALYRFYDAGGQLLYVGITIDPANRFPQHEADKPWWHEVRGISVESYDTRDEAVAAERRAIDIEQPKYNIVRPRLRRTPKRATPPTRSDVLVWVCDDETKPWIQYTDWHDLIRRMGRVDA